MAKASKGAPQRATDDRETSASGSADARVFRPPNWNAPLDLERRLGLIPADATVRGLFFNDLLAQFPSARAHALRERYMAFKNYPFREWCQLLTSAATACFPSSTPREGLRRIGKRAFPALADNQAGRVLFALAGNDVFSTFRLSSKAFALAQSLGSCNAVSLQPGLALVEIRDAWDYPDAYYVGVYEGFFEVFGKTAEIEVCVHGLADVDLRLRWKP